MAIIGSIIGYGDTLTGVISSAELMGGQVVGMRGLKGDKGDTGDTGATGNGIASISKTGSSGNVDTYTITYTNGGTVTFTVTNGIDGHSPIITASKVGKTTTIYADGEPLGTIIDGADGVNGTDGVGISSITKTSTSGLVDTYTITFTDTNTTTFNVTNGKDGIDGVDGTDGVDGQDGYSPTATVTKSGDTATITITDKNGTTTANIYDGSSGASAFNAEYGVTTYADVKDAYDEDAIIICTVDDSGNTVICQLAYFDDENDVFCFAQPQSDGFYLAIIASDDTWDDSYFTFASTETATELRNGLMTALDKQKLDGIASGAEVNVNADWDAVSGDAQILNKPTIPSKVSELSNDSGYLTLSTLPIYDGSVV